MAGQRHLTPRQDAALAQQLGVRPFFHDLAAIEHDATHPGQEVLP